MAKNDIDITIQLTGGEKVEKAVKDIEGGLQDVGETGAKLVQSMGSTNEQLGEGLENVASSVGEVREAFTELSGSIKNLGTGGMTSVLSLIGPLGMLVGAGFAVYETFRQISGAAQEAEDAQEAMAAAAGDLQGRLESLAEKGILLAEKEMVNFSVSVLEAQFLKESVQKQQEKFSKNFESIRKAIIEVHKATKDLQFVEKTYYADSERLAEARLKLRNAEIELNFQRKNAEGLVRKLNEETKDYTKAIAKLAEQEEKANKQSTEALKTEAKRLAGIVKQNDEIRFQNELRKDQIQLNEMLAEIEAQSIEITKAIEDADREKIKQILASLKQQTQGIDEITVAERKAAQERDKIIREESQKRREATKRRIEEQRKAAEQQFKRDIALQSQLNQLEIQLTKDGVEQQVALAAERFQATSKLTKEGTKEREIAEKQLQLTLQKIGEQEVNQQRQVEQQKLDLIKDANQREIEQRYSLAQQLMEVEQQDGGFGTELERSQFASEQRLAMLQLEFDKEVELAQSRGETITNLEKQYALERLRIQQETLGEQSEILTDYFDQYGRGFAEAAVSALLFGDSFQEATSQVLLSLAQQAGVEALMQTAKGFGLLALGDPKAAAAFKSAALFAAASATAGVVGSSLATGGSSPGGETPTGSPTTAPTPQREQATDSSMVFNINFGGAVVYDTKKAAEQALADRLVSIMNTNRRGSARMQRR
jgi:hypothetical protein